MSITSKQSRVTVRSLQAMKERGEKIVMLTAYDASFAAILEAAGVDVILVGDSLSNVIQGHDSTLPVTMEDVLYHTRAVARASRQSLLMADMPFMSYWSVEVALQNAARLLKEAGAQAVKLEWTQAQPDIVAALSREGIPVCAHLGLRPQAVHKTGGYQVQGRDKETATELLIQAQRVESAGADMLLLEAIPAPLAADITQRVRIPVIGIGAGVACDGQVLVLYDVLGISAGPAPRFAKNFLQQSGSVEAAVKSYVQAVKAGIFPAAEHTYQK
ncbi:MAG TPA: 3-methyl-2-oxobutanoate hydroxymethyltransferase [Gammaproteobacteria bacterium]|nr:3-methyl-2-oxobutanoate hydroxymethyltransferase [Gammaproteobacteria bacterium]